MGRGQAMERPAPVRAVEDPKPFQRPAQGPVATEFRSRGFSHAPFHAGRMPESAGRYPFARSPEGYPPMACMSPFM
ncbi:MAG: hypothetical protein AMXMBFR83_13230 [Phycisphaerae bacterium]